MANFANPRALAAARRHVGEGLLTTWPVLPETVHRVLARCGPESQRLPPR